MTTDALVRSFRRAQARSAEEQRLLSGRGWLLVAAAAQFLSTLHPLHQYVGGVILHDSAHIQFVLAGLVGAMGLLGVILVALWWWARYAPFRASVAALSTYAVFHAGIALFMPDVVFDGIASKIIVLLGLILAAHTGWKRRRAS